MSKVELVFGFEGNSDSLRCSLSGDITVENKIELSKFRQTSELKGANAVSLDCSDVIKVDSFGIVSLADLMLSRDSKGLATNLVGLPLEITKLISRAAQVEAVSQPQTKTGGRRSATSSKSSEKPAVLNNPDSVGWFTAFFYVFGELLRGFGLLIIRPFQFPMTQFVYQFGRLIYSASGLVFLLSFLTGMVLVQQGIFYMRRFGLEIFVADMMTVLALREFGVILAAILVAGRSASSFAAEIGSMRMREEVDAMKLMRLTEWREIIIPRVMAAVLGLPVLAFVGTLGMVVGSLLVFWLYAGLDPNLFLEKVRTTATLTNFLVGVIKAPIIGFFIATIAITYGYLVAGSVDSLGSRVTQAVVASIFVTIVIDGLAAMVLSAFGV